MDNERFGSGGIIYDITGNDPYMAGPTMSGVYASSYRYLAVTMSTVADECVQVYFRRSTDSSFSESRMVLLNTVVVEYNLTQTYYIDMRSNAYWNSRIVQLRFDPAGGCDFTKTFPSSAAIRINQIELVSGGPENDDFDTYRYLSSSTFTETINTTSAITAHDDPVPSCGGGNVQHTVWYQFFPGISHARRFHTTGSNYDTVISVWTGTRGNLTEIACNDDIDYWDQDSMVQVIVPTFERYYIMVGGYNGASGSLTFTDEADYPEAPTILTATATGQTSIHLTWNDRSDNESSFRVLRSLDGSTWSTIVTLNPNTESYTDTGLSCNTRYNYKIRAYVALGTSTYSNTDTETTDACPQPPATPTNLSGSAVSDTQVNLSWSDNATDETAYTVERSPDNNSWLELDTLSANTTTYSDTTMQCGTQAHYRVRAHNSTTGLYSSYSSTITVTMPDCPLLAPSDIYAIPISPTEITVYWLDNADDETGYEVQRSLDGTNWSGLTTVGTDTTSFTDSNLSCGTLHYYRVRAVRGSTLSDFTVDVSVATFNCPLNAPANPSASVTGTIQITLNWQDQSTDETAFWLEQSVTGTDNWFRFTITGADVTSSVVNGLACDQIYYFRVRAFRETDSTLSDYSSIVNATVPQCSLNAPTDLVLTVVSDTQIDAAWNDHSINETQFRLERSINGTDWLEIGTSYANDTSYADPNLTCETTYWYRVRAYRSTDASFTGYSNIATTTTGTCPPVEIDADIALSHETAIIGADPLVIDAEIDCHTESQSCDAFDIELTFDPETIQVDSVSLGDVPGNTGNTPDIIKEVIDNTAGTARVAWITYNEGNAPVRGQGALLHIAATPLRQGNTDIEVARLQGAALDGTEIALNHSAGSVQVWPEGFTTDAMSEQELLDALRRQPNADADIVLVDFTTDHLIIYAEMNGQTGLINLLIQESNGLVIITVDHITDPQGNPMNAAFASAMRQSLPQRITTAIDTVLNGRYGPGCNVELMTVGDQTMDVAFIRPGEN